MRKFLTFFVSFLSLCVISCTEKEELVIQNTVPEFGRVEAVMDGYKFAFSATISIDNPSNPYYVYGFEVSSSADMADATVVAGKGLGSDGAFTGTYDLVGWKGGDIVYYRAFISRREGEEPLYSETFKVDVPKREYDSLKFTSAGKSTIKLVNSGDNAPLLYYSYDEFKWTQWDYSELEFTKDKPIYVNGDNPKGFSISEKQYSHFSLSGSPVGCSGSVMTLIDRKNSVDKIPSDFCFKSLFAWCEILESAPLLPATTLADDCYGEMFLGCTSLQTAPALPATALADWCYEYMFGGCTSLQTAPALPATVLAESCYGYMFEGCTSLQTAPALPATVLAESCYGAMFWGCTSLQTAPALPATVLAEGCYGSMFWGCTSLQTAPALPATILAERCYAWMFWGCSSLKTAPDLPATDLARGCYQKMFYGCTSLNSVMCLATDISAEDCTKEWLSGVASTGTFVKAPGMSDWTRGASGIPEGWNVENSDGSKAIIKYMTFSSEGTSRISLKNNGDNRPKLYYSYDKTKWEEWDYSSLEFTSGKPLYLCGDNPDGFSHSSEVYSRFSTTGSDFSCEGDIMSLLDTSDDISAIPSSYCYYKLFYGCYNLQTAPNLPAAILADSCYEDMFWGCSGLKTAPSLPATTLADSCYYGMFMSCTRLEAAPELPATILSDRCYDHMFALCSSLTNAPELPVTNLAEGCYSHMFYGCANLKTSPNLPARTLAANCYSAMFSGCTSLQVAPKLPATVLAEDCYFFMFNNCTSLTTAPELPAINIVNGCYWGMFSGCTSIDTAPDLPVTTLANNCYREMFSGCSSLQTAPDLPATRLSQDCYSRMFYGCTSLNRVMCLATDISASFCVDDWLSGVASTGTFVKAPGMNDWKRGASGIPEGWNVENSDGSVDIIVNKYLTFSSEGTSKISLENNSGNHPKLYYSYDKTRWKEWNYLSLEFTSAKPLYLCGDNPEGFSHSYEVYSRFIATGSNFSCEGDIMSLLDLSKDILTIPSSYCYMSLFNACTYIKTPPELPATTLTNNCYAGMFSGCSNLQTAPKLPATTLADNCYAGMFSDCSKLQTAPDLPAIQLAEGCYKWMFYQCSSLTTAPKLPAIDLTIACYSWMFSRCSRLQTAPDLPATDLKIECYAWMFTNCTSLNSVKCLATDISAFCCIADWLDGVASDGTFVKAPGVCAWKRGSSGIPLGWAYKDAWKPEPGYENGHEWVDMGFLSGIKWATCNVGADVPSGKGYFFAWGETSPKEKYSWNNYNSTLKEKYKKDNKRTSLEISAGEDAARENWGGKWRMPTQSEWAEFVSNCNFSWGSVDGVEGCWAESKINHNKIFFPACGYMDVSTNKYPSSGSYWSASLSPSLLYLPTVFSFSEGDDKVKVNYSGGREKSYGCSVRPVL